MFFVLMLTIVCVVNCQKPEAEFVNSVGLKFKRIDPGEFMMGESNKIPDSLLHDLNYLKQGDWDEQPVHKVKISRPFYMSETEVTTEQFREFRSDFQGNEDYRPYVTGISWNEAVAFCDWLSEKEGKTYRLPTEAEWKYVCRGNSQTLFCSGDSLTGANTSNVWGVKNLHNEILEWCLDWHGSYPDADQKNPVGTETGGAKVIRGGGLDRDYPYFHRAANRGGMPPNFPPTPLSEMRSLIQEAELNVTDDKDAPEGFKSVHRYENFIRDVLNNQGNHRIGIRVVQAEKPDSKPISHLEPFVKQCVSQNTEIADIGPDPQKPYFRKRFLLPTPPENSSSEEIYAHEVLGFHHAILGHHHSPALEVCPNGDVLAIYYTSISETAPDVALIAARLRFGSDKWDMPDLFLDFPDVNDHAPMLWNDNDTLRFFWGNNKLNSGFPFQWINSFDNGAIWSTVNFPIFETKVGPHSAQPINSAFRDKDGNMYVASDGVGPHSVLWVSENNGKTWIDTGGRTGGRHTTCVLLKDGRILGMGGKSSDINRFMPKSISSDGGKSWNISKTPFCALGSNQRPTIIRLQSGRLFFAGDFQNRYGWQPEGIDQRGCYVALSDDEGETWHIKKLPGAQLHEDADRRKALRGATLGYAVARQAPNSVIHLITSMNEPCLHFAMNEAWILSKDGTATEDAELMKNTTDKISGVKEYTENYSDGKIKAKWSAGIGNDGRYLLHGESTWFYQNGKPMWQATYRLGKKVGEEVYWSMDGNKLWSWQHREDDTHIWTHYWKNGTKKSESFWQNHHAVGTATLWDRAGKQVKTCQFKNGVLID